MERLLQGIRKFQQEVFPKQEALFKQLAGEQHPHTLVITCADSRIVPQVLFQTSPGDIFLNRNIGNMVPPYGELLGGVSSTIEYAVVALGVKHIVILGHSDCGAMKGVLEPEKTKDMPTVTLWLRNADTARRMVKDNYPDLNENDLLEILTKENVIAQLENLKTHPSVATRLARGELRVHGWVYHIESGEVEAFNAQEGRFVLLDGTSTAPCATPPPRRITTRKAAESISVNVA